MKKPTKSNSNQRGEEDSSPPQNSAEEPPDQPVSTSHNNYNEGDPLREELAALRSEKDLLLQEIDRLVEKQRSQKNLEWMESLMNSVDDIIFTLDTEGRHTSVYGKWLQNFGFSPEFFMGKKAREIFGEEAGDVHEEPYKRALKGENVIYEWSGLVEKEVRHYQTSLSPIQDPEGGIVGVAGVGRDITQNKQIERELKYHKKYLESIIHNEPECVKLLEEDCTVVAMNPSGLAMVEADSADQVIGQKAWGLVAPEYQEEFKNFTQRICQGERGTLTLFRFRKCSLIFTP